MSDSAKKIRAQKKAATSATLIAVARVHFFKEGFASASMDRICEEAGVTRGALYHNFGSKTGLFEAVVRQIDAEMTESIHQSYEGIENELDAFKAACLGYFDLALDPEIGRIMMQEAPAVLGEKARKIDQEGSLRPLTDALSKLMEQDLIRDGDPSAIAHLLNGAMFDGAVAVSFSDNVEATNASMKASLLMLIDGLRKLD